MADEEERTGFKNVKDVFNHLENSRQATYLSLAYGSLTHDGCVEVAKFIRDNPFTKYLDLRGNSIHGKGTAALANGIKANRSIRTLSLKWNSIGRDNKGVESMCEALKNNLTITAVDIRNNRIDTAGAKMLADMMTENTTILRIDLSWNNFGKEGGEAILKALQRNQSIIECKMAGSKVGANTLSEVAYLVRRNQKTAAAKAPPPPAEEEMEAEAASTAQGGHDWTPAQGGYPGGAPQVRSEMDDRSLMLRLLMKEREQVLAEDRLFYTQLAEFIDKLLQEADMHKAGRNNGTEREKLATTAYLGNEERYLREIRTNEESLIQCIVDNGNFVVLVANQNWDLEEAKKELVAAKLHQVRSKQEGIETQARLEAELKEMIESKWLIKDRLALNNHDLELLEMESERLRDHVKHFKHDVSQILA